MIFDEDLDQKTKKSQIKNLYDMSIDELREYIDEMKTEIARVEEEINKKETHKSSVDGLFGSKG